MDRVIPPIITDKFRVSHPIKIPHMMTVMDTPDLVLNHSINKEIKVSDRTLLDQDHHFHNRSHVNLRWIIPRYPPRHRVKVLLVPHNYPRLSL